MACQDPLSKEFSRQEHWNGLPFPTPGDRPDPRTEPVSLESPALKDGFFTTEPSGNHLLKKNKITTMLYDIGKDGTLLILQNSFFLKC